MLCTCLQIKLSSFTSLVVVMILTSKNCLSPLCNLPFCYLKVGLMSRDFALWKESNFFIFCFALPFFLFLKSYSIRYLFFFSPWSLLSVVYQSIHKPLPNSPHGPHVFEFQIDFGYVTLIKWNFCLYPLHLSPVFSTSPVFSMSLLSPSLYQTVRLCFCGKERFEGLVWPRISFVGCFQTLQDF